MPTSILKWPKCCLCILLSKLYHIIADPPLGSQGGGERGRPLGLLQQQLHAIVRNPESSFIPTGNVELSTPASLHLKDSQKINMALSTSTNDTSNANIMY